MSPPANIASRSRVDRISSNNGVGHFKSPGGRTGCKSMAVPFHDHDRHARFLDGSRVSQYACNSTSTKLYPMNSRHGNYETHQFELLAGSEVRRDHVCKRLDISLHRVPDVIQVNATLSCGRRITLITFVKNELRNKDVEIWSMLSTTHASIAGLQPTRTSGYCALPCSR